LEGEEPLTADGALEVFYSQTDRCAIIVTSVGTCPRSITVPEGIGVALTDRISSGVTDRLTYMRAIKQLDDVVATFLKQQPQYEILSLGKDLATTAAAKFYPRAALHAVDERSRTLCLRAMTKRGFWKVLGGDLGAIRALVRLGLLDASSDTVEDRQAAGERYASDIAALEEKLALYGFPAPHAEGSPLPLLV